MVNLLDEIQKENFNSNKQTRARFLNQFTLMVENFEKHYTVSELLHTLLRKEGEKAGEKQTPYEWDDDKLLKKTEIMYKRLIKEAQSGD
jgi:hypothetical protein